MQPGAHRTDGTAENAGYFRIAQIFPVTKDQHFTVKRPQATERDPNLLPVKCAILGAIDDCIEARIRGIDHEVMLTLPSSQVIDTAVSCYAEKPGFECSRVGKRSQGPVNRKPDILLYILSCLARDVLEVSKRAPTKPAVEFCESTLIAGLATENSEMQF